MRYPIPKKIFKRLRYQGTPLQNIIREDRMNKTVKDRTNYPSYIELSESGELEERIHRAYALLESCTVCPRKCGINRLNDERGFCRTGLLPVIASFGPHFGEETPLVGTKGSGTIFVTHCNLSCEFCQNYDISQCGNGETVSCETLAGMMMSLQQRNCHNINLVTPSHVVPQIIRSVGLPLTRDSIFPSSTIAGGMRQLKHFAFLRELLTSICLTQNTER